MRLLLLTGSNVGNRKKMLDSAADAISLHLGKIEIRSEMYETAPWGKEDQSLFLNQAIIVVPYTEEPADWLMALQKAESDCGRTPSERWGPREIDIDVLLADQLVYHSESFQIPHPRMQERRFCLLPSSRIAGNWIHPVFQLSIDELLAKCTDPLPVGIYIGSDES